MFHIRPARASGAYLAAAFLLGALFGLPALAVLISPARRDGFSLAAAGLGFGVAALAGTAFLRARRERKARHIRANGDGLSWPGGSLAWSAIKGLRVEQPEPVGATGGGMHAVAANIVARQRAVSARLVLDPQEGGAPLLLASGLGVAVAGALRAALLRHDPRPGQDVLTSEPPPQ